MVARFPPPPPPPPSFPRESLRLPPPASLFRSPPSEPRSRNPDPDSQQSASSDRHRIPPHLEKCTPSQRERETWNHSSTSSQTSSWTSPSSSHVPAPDNVPTRPHRPVDFSHGSVASVDRHGSKRSLPEPIDEGFPSKHRHSEHRSEHRPEHRTDHRNNGAAALPSRSDSKPQHIYRDGRRSFPTDYATHPAYPSRRSVTDGFPLDRSSEFVGPSPVSSQPRSSPGLYRGVEPNQPWLGLPPSPASTTYHEPPSPHCFDTAASIFSRSRAHSASVRDVVEHRLHAHFDRHPHAQIDTSPHAPVDPDTRRGQPNATSQPSSSHLRVSPQAFEVRGEGGIRSYGAATAAFSPLHSAAMLPPVVAPSDPLPSSAVLGLGIQGQQAPQRKRLRISRACDECRRRKTRCDVIGAFPGEAAHPSTIAGLVPLMEPQQEPTGEMLILRPCMNCQRSGITCAYSKRPLKRGPSKGYIKDLERRLNSLESQITAPDAEAKAAAASSSATTDKPRVRAEDRIVRLEEALRQTRPAEGATTEGSAGRDKTNHNDDEAVAMKAEPDQGCEGSGPVGRAHSPHSSGSPPPALSPSSSSSPSPSPSPSELPNVDDVVSAPASALLQVLRDQSAQRGENATPAGSAWSRRQESSPPSTAQPLKETILQSSLHATFPVASYGDGGRALAGLGDKVLQRGFRILAEALEPPSAAGTAGRSPSGAAMRTGKNKPHSARLAHIIGQASAGLISPNGDLQWHDGSGRQETERLKKMRQLAADLALQEADLLLLCQLDLFRHGQANNSALAAAVTKLGLGTEADRASSPSLRRKVVIFMMDRWHSAGFGTAHVLTGRHELERMSLHGMKETLSDAERSPLSSGCYEVLRAAIMLGHLHDLAHSAGGWKNVSHSDLESIIHSVAEESESATRHDAIFDATSDEALRYSLENAVRTHHLLHVLPRAEQARLPDVARLFEATERILCLGKVKTPTTPMSKLYISAIGPHVAALAAVSFYWCYHAIAILAGEIYNVPAAAASSSSSSSLSQSQSQSQSPKRADGLASELLQPLEFYRRKMLDYVRMLCMNLLASGGTPNDAASFRPLYLRIVLFLHQTLGFSTRLGPLLQVPAADSPARDDAEALFGEADSLADLCGEMGCLGYILATTSATEAWSLVAQS
ncbi:hypothetical protein ACQY0O_002566 [Thecaphora frezii]